MPINTFTEFENLGMGQTSANITTGTTTTVKTGLGRLEHIVVGTVVSGATITIYDNTAASGTKIATVTCSAVLTPFFLTFGRVFTIGLTVVTSGATDVTVVYR